MPYGSRHTATCVTWDVHFKKWHCLRAGCLEAEAWQRDVSSWSTEDKIIRRNLQASKGSRTWSQVTSSMAWSIRLWATMYAAMLSHFEAKGPAFYTLIKSLATLIECWHLPIISHRGDSQESDRCKPLASALMATGVWVHLQVKRVWLGLQPSYPVFFGTQYFLAKALVTALELNPSWLQSGILYPSYNTIVTIQTPPNYSTEKIPALIRHHHSAIQTSSRLPFFLLTG